MCVRRNFVVQPETFYSVLDYGARLANLSGLRNGSLRCYDNLSRHIQIRSSALQHSTYGRSGQNMFRLRTSSQTSLQSQNHSILPQMMLQFGVRLPRAFHISIDRGLTLRMRPGEEVALSSTTRAVLVQKRLNCTGRRSRLKPSLSPSPSEVLSPFWQSIVRVLLNQLRHSLRSSQPCWSSLQSITSSWS